MAAEYKVYKSIRVPEEVYAKVEALKRRQELRFYEQNPEGTTSMPGRVTMYGIILLALELLERQMNIEDGVPTVSAIPTIPTIPTIPEENQP